VCICIYTYMHMRTHNIHTYVRTHPYHIHTYIHINIHNKYLLPYIHTHTAYMHSACRYAWIHTYTYVQTYILTYIHTYIGTYIRVRTYMTYTHIQNTYFTYMYIHYIVHTYIYTYIITPWCRVLEKLTGLQLVKKFPAFHGTRRFITALTSVRHLSIPGQPTPVHMPTSHLLEIHPNIIHPSTPRSP